MPCYAIQFIVAKCNVKMKRTAQQASLNGMESGAIIKRSTLVDVPLNKKQQEVFNFCTGNDRLPCPLFVYGTAGTGKSVLIQALRKHFTREGLSCTVVAYTNLAARNVDGQTIHSSFGFDFNLCLRDFKRPALIPPHCVIIDEISMVPAEMLDGINSRLRHETGCYDLPFGGVKMIVFGDLLQLPPVSDKQSFASHSSRHTRPPYEASVWNQFKMVQLTENMRQSEEEFITALNQLRVGDVQCIDYFKTLTSLPPKVDVLLENTSLVPTRKEASQLNEQCYRHIRRNQSAKHEEFTVTLTRTMTNKRPEHVYKKQQLDMIFSEGLKYCVGARVMVTYNVQGRFCNGDVGYISDINEKGLWILRDYDAEKIPLNMVDVCFETASKDVFEEIRGLPLCHAWGLTIHKSQGMTLTNVIVYPTRVFEKGQLYVALSRAKSSKSLKIVGAVTEKGIIDMKEAKQALAEVPVINFEDALMGDLQLNF